MARNIHEFDVPNGFKRVEKENAHISKEALQLGNKELVLFRLPHGMTADDLKDVKLDLTKAKTPGTEIGNFKSEKGKFKVLTADSVLADQLCVALPSNENPESFSTGHTIARTVSVVTSYDHSPKKKHKST